MISSNTNPKTVFEFNIDDDLINILYPDLSFGKNTKISGTIDDDFKLDVLSSKIKFNEYEADSVYLFVDNSLKSNNFIFKGQ